MASIEPQPGGVQIAFEEAEADLLRDLLGEMQRVLEREAGLDQRVIDRLFPSAYAAPEDAQAFADLVGGELERGKVDAVETVLGFLGERGPAHGTVATKDLDPWLTALTDVRLALGTRLEVTEEKMEHELTPDDPEAMGMSVLHWLGWLQESLLSRVLTREGDG